jgi:two-component system, NtrC family, sensor histidine kinase KinB
MKNSIRTRFSAGMIFLFVIILVLSVFSGYYLNKLSNKTSAILKENYLSVLYARVMSEGLMNINQVIITGFITNRIADSLGIAKEINNISNSLLEEKNNITEPGEDKLVSDIEKDYTDYRNSALKIIKSSASVSEIIVMQRNFNDLYQKLSLLAEMNGKALEVKTEDAKASAKSALTQMTVLATLCFLIGMSFIISFSSYFSHRFFQLYNGIKEVVSSNFDQKLYFDGNDEFYEISQVFNEMAGILKDSERKMSVTLHNKGEKDISLHDLEALKEMLFRIKSLEVEAAAIISKFEKK